LIRQKGALIGGITALALLLFVVLGATTIHAQSSSSDSSQSCSALGTPQEDGNCQGTAQYGDQSGADTELNLTEVDE
jgi:hypothetical protein